MGGIPSPHPALTATIVSLSNVTLTWTNTSNEEYFQIFRAITSNPYSLLGTVSVDITTYSDTSISTPITHTYRVQAFNSAGESYSLPVFIVITTANIGTSSSVSSYPISNFATDWLLVAAGDNHTFAIKTDKSLWSWGYNQYGQLGLGDTNNRKTPSQIGTESDWSIVTAGSNNLEWGHTISIKTNRTIWSWGRNDLCQLGLGDTNNRMTPSQVGTESDWSITACGANYTLGIKTNGTIWSWGWNQFGQLGLGDTMDRNIPTQSGLLIPNPPASLTVNIFSSARIDLSWVDFAYNEAGFKIERKIRLTGTWQQIATVGSNVVSYSDISETGFAPLTTYGYRVRTYNGFGNSLYSNEKMIALSGDWSAIEAGACHTIALKTNGTLWSCGSNDNGELGVGGYESRNTFSQIGTNSDWISIAAGGDKLGSHTIARKTNGTIWTWGYNDFGQLGLKDLDKRDQPCQVGIESDWSLLALGGYHSAGLKTNGTIWVWGQNTYGQLGLGDSDTGIDRNTPTQIGSNSDWFSIAEGESNTIAGKVNGTLWAWGYNYNGQLGLGDTMNRNTPTQIGFDSDWYIILTGDIHTLARKTNGTLWVWGSNFYGELGLGDSLDRYTPIQMGSEIDWSAITAGYSHTIALRNNGTIWSWGQNNCGQLGLGDTIDRNVPTLVGE
jgi:alpha-tubulin suppressor-like RCC1 family protein